MNSNFFYVTKTKVFNKYKKGTSLSKFFVLKQNFDIITVST